MAASLCLRDRRFTAGMQNIVSSNDVLIIDAKKVTSIGVPMGVLGVESEFINDKSAC